MPGDGLEDLVLRPLDVEDEPVDCGVAQRQEEGVERNTLEGNRVRTFLLTTISPQLSKIKIIMAIKALYNRSFHRMEANLMPERHSTSTHQDYSSHGPDVVLAVQHGCGVGVEVDIVRPALPLVHSRSHIISQRAQLKSSKYPN